MKVTTAEDVKKFTRLTFVALYPFLMFDNVYGKNIMSHFNLKLVGFSMGILAILVVGTWIYVCSIEKEDYNRGAMIQAIYRSNYVLMGLPIAINLFGKSSVAAVAVVMIFIVPTYNIVAVVIFERFKGGKPKVSAMIKGVFTNPLIVGAIVGIAMSIVKIELPASLMVPIVGLSDATTPIAMVLLGASLNLEGMRNESKRVAICVIGKLIVLPAIGITAAILCGFRDIELVAIVLFLATPSALASFTMASSMGGNGEVAGNAVVFSTIISCATLPIWLFALKTMGMF